MSWEKPVGLLLLFLFCILGLREEDKKLRFLSWAIGVVSALTLIGWSEGLLIKAQQSLSSLSVNPDVFGVSTSALALGMSQFIPAKSARRTAQTTAVSGLALSLLGIPMWVMWAIVLAIVACIIVAACFVLKRIANWISTLVKGS
ncbi:MAG: hypothetical protein ACUVTB_06160 [Candidatus Bathycorpusculaceae bacterium]